MSATTKELADLEIGVHRSLAALEHKFSGQLTTITAAKYVGGDASTLLGLDFQQKQYNSRREALLDPAAYARHRATAFDTMRTAVNDKFDTALVDYTKSGMPPAMAKEYALRAAANESATQQQVFEMNYPSGANILEMKAQAPRLMSLGGQQNTAVGPARRRAPARRRTRRR